MTPIKNLEKPRQQGLDVPLREFDSEKPRVMFASLGWPTGIIEVASYAKNKGLAEVSICPVEVYERESYDHGLNQKIMRYASRKGLKPRFFEKGGMLNEETEKLLLDREFVEALMGKQPTVVGFSVTKDNIEDVKKCVKMVRHFTDALVVLGGPQTTQFPAQMVKELGADFGFAGEGEEIFGKFLKAVGCRDTKAEFTKEDYERFLEIPGLAFWYGGKVAHNILPKDESGRNALEPTPLFSADGKDMGDFKAGDANGLVKLFAAKDLQLSQDAKVDRIGKDTWRITQQQGSNYYIHERNGAYDIGYSITQEERRALLMMVRPFVGPQAMNDNVLQWSLMRGSSKGFDGIVLNTIRGCPGGCVFCSHIQGREVRPKGAKEIMRDIEALDREVSKGRINVDEVLVYSGVDDPAFRKRNGYELTLGDDDFLLDRERALEFFGMWDKSKLKDRYRLSIGTNPLSLIKDGKVDMELMSYIDKFKTWVGMGAESFDQKLLTRWRKRHTVKQLDMVLDELEKTGQEYTANLIQTDYDMTPQECIENLGLTAVNAVKRGKMVIGYVSYQSPVESSTLRRKLEDKGLLKRGEEVSYDDYHHPHLELMDPLVVKMMDAASKSMRALSSSQRERSYLRIMQNVTRMLEEEAAKRSPHELDGLIAQSKAAETAVAREIRAKSGSEGVE